MKKILLGILACGAVFSSCSGFLEETAYSSFSKEEAFKNPTLVYLNTVQAVYSGMAEQGMALSNTNNYYLLSEFSSDLAYMPTRFNDWLDGGARQALFLHTWSTSYNVFNSLWNHNWGQIGKCNTAIDSIQEIIDEMGDNDGIFQGYINELRGIRAYYYYLSCNIWGNVPIVESSDQSVSSVNQSGRASVYEFVRDELCEIIPTLSDEKCSNQSSEYYGRFTKSVAYALMAKLAANAAVFAYDNWHDGSYIGGFDKVEPIVTERGKEQKITLDGVERNAWETVIYCHDQLAAAGYDLDPDFNSVFNVGNESSIENIFIRPNDVTTYRLNQHTHWWGFNSEHAMLYTPARGGGNGNCSTKACAEIFGVKYDAQKGASVDGYDVGQADFDPANAAEDYSQADPRWDKSFFYGAFTIDGKVPGSGIAGSPYTRGNYLAYQGQLHMQFSTDLAANAQNPDWANYIVRWSGCRPKKPEVDKTDVHTQFSYYSNADIVVYRMADMILLAAEAYYRLGDSGKALELINKVRGRVGADSRTSLSIKDISDERALELMWEPTRREDQIRFGTYAEPTVDKNENTACAAISAGDWSGKAGWYKDTEGTTLVFPIPQSVLELNKNLKQNYGYTL